MLKRLTFKLLALRGTPRLRYIGLVFVFVAIIYNIFLPFNQWKDFSSYSMCFYFACLQDYDYC